MVPPFSFPPLPFYFTETSISSSNLTKSAVAVFVPPYQLLLYSTEPNTSLLISVFRPPTTLSLLLYIISIWKRLSLGERSPKSALSLSMHSQRLTDVS